MDKSECCHYADGRCEHPKVLEILKQLRNLVNDKNTSPGKLEISMDRYEQHCPAYAVFNYSGKRNLSRMTLPEIAEQEFWMDCRHGSMGGKCKVIDARG